MIPLALNPSNDKIGLAGRGAAALRRLRNLRAGGALNLVVYTDDAALAAQAGENARLYPPEAADFYPLQLLYIAGLEAAQYEPLAAAARAAKIFVNVEDVPELCDFHSVAEIRRGDLLLTVSTGGAAPGLAGSIRRALEGCFAPEWEERVAEIAALRQGWRAENVPMSEAAARIGAIVDERCWLACPKPA